MFRIVVFLALLACALSFAPTSRVARCNSLKKMSEAAAPVAEAPVEAAPVAKVVEFSRSLPFLTKPKNLDGMIVRNSLWK
jgi:hypothetical protein